MIATTNHFSSTRLFLKYLKNMTPSLSPSKLLFTRLNILGFSPVFSRIILERVPSALFWSYYGSFASFFKNSPPPCSEQPKVWQKMASLNFKSRQDQVSALWKGMGRPQGPASLSPNLDALLVPWIPGHPLPPSPQDTGAPCSLPWGLHCRSGKYWKSV